MQLMQFLSIIYTNRWNCSLAQNLSVSKSKATKTTTGVLYKKVFLKIL